MKTNICFFILFIIFGHIYIYIFRRMTWAGHVGRMGEDWGRLGSWWGNWRERDHWGDLGVDG